MKLKPCPFCGGEAELKDGKKGQAANFDDIYVAECVACGMCNWDWQDTEAEAITAWNQRHPDTQALVEALVEALAIFDEPMSPLTAGERGGELACAVRTFLSSTGDSK